MEIKEVLHVEILHTLEKIDSLNKAIRFHSTMEGNQDKLAIEQYEQQKANLTAQLLQLLKAMDLRLEVAA